MAQTVKRLPTMQEAWIQSLGQEDLVEKEMATHCSILTWKILWTEEPSRSTGLQRVRNDWVTSLSIQYLFFFLNYLSACWVFAAVRPFASYGEQKLCSAGRAWTAVVVSLVVEPGSVVVASGPWSMGSIAVAPGPSGPAACGIFPDQGLNPCLLHWQVESLPLSHQGSPFISISKRQILREVLEVS